MSFWKLRRTGELDVVFDGECLFGDIARGVYSEDAPRTFFEKIGLFKTKAGRLVLAFNTGHVSYGDARSYVYLDADQLTSQFICSRAKEDAPNILRLMGRDTVERIE